MNNTESNPVKITISSEPIIRATTIQNVIEVPALGLTAGIYGGEAQIPVIEVDERGKILQITQVPLNLDPFVLKEDLSKILIDLTTTLTGFITSEELVTTLNSYPTNEDLTNTLEAYPTNEELTNTLEAYPTSEELTNTLEAYPTNEELTTTLEAYPTSEELTTTLEAYPTSEDLTQAITNNGIGFKANTTLPTNPSNGQPFVHTPTGRAWEMKFINGTWYATYAYGKSILYATDKGVGSKSFNDGYSSTTPVDIEWLLKNLPKDIQDDIEIYLAPGTYSDEIYWKIRGIQGGKIKIFGATTTKVSDLQFVSATSDWRVLTFNKSTSSVSQGDVLKLTSDGGYSRSWFDFNAWCVYSASGNTITLPGGGCFSNTTQTPTSMRFEVLSRETYVTFRKPRNHQDIDNDNVEFHNLSFYIKDSEVSFINGKLIRFIGCWFICDANGYLRGLSRVYLIACHLLAQNNGLRCLSGSPTYIVSCFINYLVNTSSSLVTLTSNAFGANYCEIIGTYIKSQRNGIEASLIKVKLATGSVDPGTSGNHIEVGGSSYYGIVLLQGAEADNATSGWITMVGANAGILLDQG